jgi:hypothetical protein
MRQCRRFSWRGSATSRRPSPSFTILTRCLPACLAAHQALDAAVEKCYRTKPFTSDEERLEYLFALYEKMTAEENA